MLKTAGILARRRTVGAIVVIVSVVFVALATLRPNPFHKTHVVWAEFAEAKGLARVERDVRVAGVNVGHIGAVHRVGDHALVQLVLNTDAGTVYRDATAELRPHHPFEGDAFVDLHPGHPAAGPIGKRPIPLSQTSVYVSLDQSLRAFDAERRASVQRIVAELSRGSTPDTEQSVSRLLGRLPALTRNLSLAIPAARGPSGNELRATVQGFGRVALAVGRHPERISQVVQRANQTLAAVDVDNGAALASTLHSLPPALAQLRAGSAQLNGLATEVGQAARDARPAVAAMTPTLRDGRPLFAKAAPVLVKARPLIQDVRVVLNDLATATPPLRQVMSLSGGAIDDLNLRALPALRAKSRLGQPAFDQFLSSGAGLTGAIAPYQTLAQNPFGGGHYIRISGDVADGAFGALQGDGCAQLAKLLPSVHDELVKSGACH